MKSMSKMKSLGSLFKFTKKKVEPESRPVFYVPKWMRRMEIPFDTVFEEFEAGNVVYSINHGITSLPNVPVTFTKINLPEDEFLPYTYRMMMDACHPSLEDFVTYAFGNVQGNPVAVLVYKKTVGSALYDYLDGTQAQLEWQPRLKIIYQVAQGMACLHKLNQVHGCLDASKIILDADLSPKITEYWLHIDADRGEDTVSFGRILLHLLTGKNYGNDLFLDKVKVKVEQFPPDPFIDNDARHGDYKKLLKIVSHCLHEKPENRYSMVDILLRLHKLNLGIAF